MSDEQILEEIFDFLRPRTFRGMIAFRFKRSVEGFDVVLGFSVK